MKNARISKFKYAAAPFALGLALISVPSFAQDEDVTAQAEVKDDDNAIVVTGSIFRGTTSDTVSPITVVTSEDLDKRGINTVQDAIQQLSSNNGPALTNSFSANGAFAAGASAVSLRGLSTNSTLVLFDGQRAAYYPLADDGSRNFVDLNTIPDDIVDRVEVLRDGASSTYGADAIAGVVNIITKREFQGVSGRAEAGITEDGVGANQRLSLTVGTGSLEENGMNAYLSGFYYRSEKVMNRDLPYPFNTDDKTSVCFENNCGPNDVLNGDTPNTGFLVPYDLYVRPYNATNTAAIPGGRNELLNPTLGCQYGPGYRLTAAQAAALPTAPAATDVCTVDITERFGTATPNIDRFGGSFRVTARVGDSSEAYFMGNFQQSTVSYNGFPATIRGNANAGILFRPFSTSTVANAALAPGSYPLSLPVYVCANGVGDASGVNTGCNAGNGVLNPNNPFAAQGQVARLLGRFPGEPTYNETRSRVYRAALGISGTIADDWDYAVDATAMHNDLRRTQNGYVYIANLLTAIAQGRYNFRDPAANSQETLDFISPDNITDASSDLYALQGTIGTTVAELPGGPLKVGVGAQIRYEAVDAPSANDDTNGPTQRYFTLNAFGTTGDRTVKSAFFEVNAPITTFLELNGSGRYDDYSSGQSAFSPKIGARLQPIEQVTLRATYSKGFRIPAFGEANALPTTGFVNVATATLPQSFLSQYGAGCTAATPANCSTYITSYARGLTTLASPDLKPEKSRSFTAGIVVAPIPEVRLTVDYFNIKKTNSITSAPIQPALDAYFAGQPIPAGYNVIADAPDINNPLSLPRPAFVESPLINANTIKSEGLDFAALVNLELGDVSFQSSLEASYIINLSTTFPDGSTQSYEGTLGNYALTAGSGTPEWRGSWQNSITYDAFTLTGTVNYVDGYNLSAEDETGPDTAGDCGLGVPYTPCDVGSYTTVDLVGQFRVNEDFTFYVNVLNAFNKLPDVDAATYGAHLYNPVQAGSGIFGRAYRAGVRFNF